MLPACAVSYLCFERSLPVFTTKKRSLDKQAPLRSSKRQTSSLTVPQQLYTVVSPASRPAGQAASQHDKMTSAHAAGQPSPKQLREQQLVLAKAWNFILGASGVFLFPYIPIFLQSRGLSPAQIGVLAALRPWLAAPICMTASALADKHKAHVKLLLVSAALGALLRSSMPLADSAVLVMVMLLAGELIGAPTGVLGDSTVLSNCKDPGDYGEQRQWGSIGYGLLSIPAGYIIQHTGITSAFLIYGLASIPLLFIGSKLRYDYFMAGSISSNGDAKGDSICSNPEPVTLSEKLDKQTIVNNHAHAAAEPASVQDLLQQPMVLLFLWRCLLGGFGFGVISSYEFLYLKGLGAPETLMGIALMMSVCTEVPAFKYQGTLMKHMSAPMLLNIALGTTALRLAAYAALPGLGNTWAVLPVELLHGITFGIFFCTATVYSSKLAPAKLGATMQGMFQSTYGGVGAGLGGLVGGYLMDRLGGQGLFFTSAVLVAAGGVLGVVADRVVAAMSETRVAAGDKSKVE